MIARLRRKLTLLVIAVLVIVTSGIVFAISYANYRAVEQRAYAALRSLARNRGARPGMPRMNGPRDNGFFDENGPADFNDNVANLSNFYTVSLDDDGGVESWSSDREGLYTDDEVASLTAAALAQGRETGRVNDQYFRLWDSGDNRRLIVLDARLEHLAARSVLRTTALVAGLACALLSAGAWLLIGRMVKPVEAAFERQKQFVWDASHEFKTPLAVISANAEVLAGEIGENEYLGYIQSALLGVALPFESTVYEAGRTFETDIPDGVFIRGDSEMLQQLAVILLSNALKYSDEGGTIRLSLAQKGHGCRISVYNTGPGIAPENLERIFDRFYREDLSHNSEIAGNGLGLAIARNIVEAHKGKIHAESNYGKDATFIVTLPT